MQQTECVVDYNQVYYLQNAFICEVCKTTEPEVRVDPPLCRVLRHVDVERLAAEQCTLLNDGSRQRIAQLCITRWTGLCRFLHSLLLNKQCIELMSASMADSDVFPDKSMWEKISIMYMVLHELECVIQALQSGSNSTIALSLLLIFKARSRIAIDRKYSGNQMTQCLTDKIKNAIDIHLLGAPVPRGSGIQRNHLSKSGIPLIFVLGMFLNPCDKLVQFAINVKQEVCNTIWYKETVECFKGIVQSLVMRRELTDDVKDVDDIAQITGPRKRLKTAVLDDLYAFKDEEDEIHDTMTGAIDESHSNRDDEYVEKLKLKLERECRDYVAEGRVKATMTNVDIMAYHYERRKQWSILYNVAKVILVVDSGSVAPERAGFASSLADRPHRSHLASHHLGETVTLRSQYRLLRELDKN